MNPHDPNQSAQWFEEWALSHIGNPKTDIVADDHERIINYCEQAWNAALASGSSLRLPSEDELMEADDVDWDDPLGVYHWLKERLNATTTETPRLRLPSYDAFVKYWNTDEAVQRANKFNFAKSELCFYWVCDEIECLNATKKDNKNELG